MRLWEKGMDCAQDKFFPFIIHQGKVLLEQGLVFLQT